MLTPLNRWQADLNIFISLKWSKKRNISGDNPAFGEATKIAITTTDLSFTEALRGI
jgi:hypothetical protein